MHHTGQLSSGNARLIMINDGPEDSLNDNKVPSEIKWGEGGQQQQETGTYSEVISHQLNSFLH
jgi:hypothetical protein